MAQIKGSAGKLFLNGKEIGTASGWELDLGEPTAEELAQVEKVRRGWKEFARALKGHAFEVQGTFEPSPAFWGILVGMQLRYGLRELHRNLGRYSQWPYTN